MRQPDAGCILQLNTSRIMVQTQHIYVFTTHPPAHPYFKRGAGEGCILVNPKLYLLLQIKNSFPKCRTVKHVLTRSSEFQQNRKERNLRGTEIPRKKNKKFNSTENPIKQTRAKTISYKQKMSSHAHKLKTSKSSSETDFRKKKRIKKLI